MKLTMTTHRGVENYGFVGLPAPVGYYNIVGYEIFSVIGYNTVNRPKR